MKPYVISRQARKDIRDSRDYLAERSLPAAVRFQADLKAAFERLAQRPELGHRRDDLVDRALDLRFWQVGHHFAIYRIVAEQVQVARVLSHHRDIRAIFAES